jgi:hypothetical protein
LYGRSPRRASPPIVAGLSRFVRPGSDREDRCFSCRKRAVKEVQMISGAHVIVYSKDAEADRAFFRDILGFKYVDAGHGC